MGNPPVAWRIEVLWSWRNSQNHSFFIVLRLLFSGIDRVCALLPVNSSWRCPKSKLYYCFKIISIDIDGKTVSGVAFYEKLQGTRLSQIPVHKYQDFIEIPPTLTSCNFLLSGRMKKSGCAFWSYVSVLSILLLFIDLEREKHTFRCWSKFEISINWHSHPQLWTGIWDNGFSVSRNQVFQPSNRYQTWIIWTNR